MRASYFMGCTVFLFGALATFGSFGTTPRAMLSTIGADSIALRNTEHPTVTIAEDLPAQGGTPIRLSSVPPVSIDRNIAIGEKLTALIELRPIPNHESYRYAIVNNHRVIVDAVSREIVYVVQ